MSGNTMLSGDRGTVFKGLSGLWLADISSDDEEGKDLLLSGFFTAIGEGFDWWTLGELAVPFW